MKIEAGKTYIFNSIYPDLEKYNGTDVFIIGQKTEILTSNKILNRKVYRVKFFDGYISEAFGEELR